MEKPKSTDSSPRSAQTRCGNCHRRIVFKRELLGRVAKCPGCGESLRLELSDEAVLDTAMGIVHTTASAESTEKKSDPPKAPNEKGARMLGRFELRRRLGRGGFGEVWEADDTSLNRKVAIKLPLYPPSETKKIQRFLTEGRAAASLRHPNIVGVLDAGVIDSQHFLATELVVGQPLNTYFAEKRCLPNEAARLVSTLARALDYAHSRKIVHRDIKPHNIVLNENKQPQLLDFGLAKILEEDAGNTIDGTVMGTPAYMAPEQARGDLSAIGPRTDQYSLGATLYWLLTGRALFEGPRASLIAQVIGASPKKPTSLVPDLDPRLEAVCLKSVSKDPADRYSSCLELARDLERFLRDEVVEARPISAFGRVLRWMMRHPRDAILTATVSIFLFAAMLFSTSGWYTASSMAVSARSAEIAAQQKLTELEQTERKMQDELNRLNDSKARSEQANRDEAAAQAAAEETRRQLQQAIDENLALKKAADEQLSLFNKNSSSLSIVDEEVALSQSKIAERQAKLLSLSEIKKQVLDKLAEVSTAIENSKWDTAKELLLSIPAEKRNWHWMMLAERTSKKSVSLECVASDTAFDAVLLSFDLAAGLLLVVENNRQRHRSFRRYCWLDISTGSVVAEHRTDDPLLAFSRELNMVATADVNKITVGTPNKPLRKYTIPYQVVALKVSRSGDFIAIGRRDAPDSGLLLVKITLEGAKILWDIHSDQSYMHLLAKMPKSPEVASGPKLVAFDDKLDQCLVVYRDSRFTSDMLVQCEFTNSVIASFPIMQISGPTSVRKKNYGSDDVWLSILQDGGLYRRRIAIDDRRVDLQSIDTTANHTYDDCDRTQAIDASGKISITVKGKNVLADGIRIGTLSFSAGMPVCCDSRGEYIAFCNRNAIAIYKCPRSPEL